jgi:hypothetical protein
LHMVSLRSFPRSGNPFQASVRADEWIPAFGGMTIRKGI